jgi:hypothetical protein
MDVVLHLGFVGFLALLGVIWAAVMVAICIMESKAYDAEYEEVEE